MIEIVDIDPALQRATFGESYRVQDAEEEAAAGRIWIEFLISVERAQDVRVIWQLEDGSSDSMLGRWIEYSAGVFAQIIENAVDRAYVDWM